MDAKYIVKLTLGVQAIEPVRSLQPGPPQTKILMGGEMMFFGEHRDPAAAISTALQPLMNHIERLYGPVMLPSVANDRPEKEKEPEDQGDQGKESRPKLVRGTGDNTDG